MPIDIDPLAYGFGVAVDKRLDLPLAERPVGKHDATRNDRSPGRRLRVFATLANDVSASLWGVTYGEALTRATDDAAIREMMSVLQLRTFEGPIRASRVRPGSDPSLHQALQDLGDEINEDVHEAAAAFDDPDIYYPGIDDGIEPVTDEHVALVIWAMQRELNRELRPPPGYVMWAVGHQGLLPATPLADLPWRVQRALAERRRWRYAQWGITRESWARGTWSLWDVPLDPEYVPRRAQRLMAD